MKSIFLIGLTLTVLFLLNFISSDQKEGVNEAPPDAMGKAVAEFLESLSEQQKSIAVFEFKSSERTNWHYIPRSRKGVPMEDLSAGQRQKALEMIRTVMSDQGYQKSVNIMELEGILGELEGRSDYRNPQNYYLSVFGIPSDLEPWGWRIEGHHLSLNFSSVTNELAVTPSFMGANPAVVPDGPKKGWQVLKNEQELARNLVKELDDAQKKLAIISEEAPGDIITGADRTVRLSQREGLPVARMSDPQKDLFRQLLDTYIGNMNEKEAKKQWALIEEAGIEELYFAWAGGVSPSEGHYYRIHGPTLLIEYDNTQSGANHVHTVWRDLTNDFGEDMLRKHYSDDH